MARRGIYDNMRTAVDKVHKGKGRTVNARFSVMCAHYLYDPDFCNVASGWEKGRGEKNVQDSRRRIWIDAARHRFSSFVELNAWLSDRCRALCFANLEDLNHQLRAWLDTVANAPVHGSTGRIVAEHFAAERASLKPLPTGRVDAVLRTERRVSHEGMVSVGGNLYSVPDGTTKRVLEVETTADCVRIHDGHRLVAVHVLLHGRRQRSLQPGHRQPRRSSAAPEAEKPLLIQPLGHSVARRGLEIYAAVAERLGAASRAGVPARN